MTGPLVLKLGGELIETAAARATFAQMALALQASRPLVVVHGGGRAIDAELARRQIAPNKVDGIRITDAPTLEAVVAVLAGTANTELVAALDADPALAEAFAALTPGRQKSWALFLNDAKTPATRLSRIEKGRARIIAGKGATER